MSIYTDMKMTGTGKKIDWKQEAQRAGRMTYEQLWGAILDAQKTLHSADELDRTHGTDDGGFYRDQISVYRREMSDRQHVVRRNKAEV